MTNLAANQNGVWMGLLWQAGAKPFENTGADSVKVIGQRRDVEEGRGLLGAA